MTKQINLIVNWRCLLPTPYTRSLITSDLNRCKRKKILKQKRHRKFSNEFIAMKMFLFLQFIFCIFCFIFHIYYSEADDSIFVWFCVSFKKSVCVCHCFYLSLCLVLPKKKTTTTMKSLYNSTTEMLSRGFYLWSFART